jgi:coatomer subunit alpha
MSMENKLLTKFESKGNRVKGLAFHSVRPWVLASLHNGVIQLWDYQFNCIVDKFEEHDGPVRGIDFHRSQPLIASGGDDYKVKVWDYKLRRCLFTLLGHLDYIRTVQFHCEYPWIVSASDDQTIRIWNWQSRSCISVLTGHNHYVMCAAFHPKDDLVVSASLDQTVRVWDTTGLRKKTVRGRPAQMDDGNVVSRVNNELFGGDDACVKYVLEGHERGVNWASFHATLPLVVSGADDRQIKLWRMNETKAWEVDTMRGHTNNVSCVLFHPKHELIVSNSEDRTIRVWDISKRLGVQTFRRESDRFWILAAHPEQNLLAAGHDSGMSVFKLERERPAFDVVGNKCFYIKERYLRLHELGNGREAPLVSLRRSSSNNTPGIGGGPRHLTYNVFNKAENNVLITSDADGGSYELITFGNDFGSSSEAKDVRRGSGMSAVFLARDRFAVLDKSRQIMIKNFQNDTNKKVNPPLAGVDGLFPTGVSNRIIMKSEDRLVLFDLQARKVLAELQVPRIKYVVWNKDHSMVAFISKHQVVLANKNLEQLCASTETVRLKGGAWDGPRKIFIYSTSSHIKYLIPNGDRGIIRGLESPIYITKVHGNNLFCLDREGKVRVLEIDATEALFKLALEAKNYPEVMRMVKHSRLCGQSIITYLTEKGYPEVALHFVTDNKARFDLALACGNIKVAMSVAKELGDAAAWRQLGIEAFRQGNHEVVESCYVNTREYERMSFLYVITGNTKKLGYMLQIAEKRDDVMSQFQNAMLLGDAEQRVKILEATGQLTLAYIAAASHGLTEDMERLKSLLEGSKLSIPTLDDGPKTLLQPPTAIIRGENWPLLAVQKNNLTDMSEAGTSNGLSVTADGDEDDEIIGGGDGQWGDDDDLFDDEDDEGGDNKKSDRVEKARGGGWEDEDELDLSDDEPAVTSKQAQQSGDGDDFFAVPQAGNPPTIAWCESPHAADHFAAGSAESALTLLKNQIAAVDVSTLKQQAISLFLGASGFVPGAPLGPSSKIYITRDGGSAKGNGMPMLSVKLPPLLDLLKSAYRSFTSGAFPECEESMQTIITSIPLIQATSRAESTDIKEMVDICREYITAVRVNTAMKEMSGDAARQLELACYRTHCKLQSSHLTLVLNSAMTTAYKAKVSTTTIPSRAIIYHAC